MGSNSLLEGMVLGRTAGLSVSSGKSDRHRHRPERILRRKLDEAPQGIELGISDLVYSLKSLMWRQVGLEREEKTLTEAQEHLSFWFDAVMRLAPAEARAWELVNMLTVANLATMGAKERRESRGVHYRTDYLELEAPAHTIISSCEMDDHCVEGAITRVSSEKTLTYGCKKGL
jgi:L-aspartate oxidase